MSEMLNSIDFTPFLISFKLATVVSLLLFCICVPFAWYLSQTKMKIKPILEALSALPIVLPPSVLGFYILIAFSHNSPIGKFFNNIFGIKLVFSFEGLVVASCLYSFPFMLQPLQNGFENLHKNMIEASFIAGKSKMQTLLKIALPNIKPSIMTAVVITFAHTVGEFGVVLMVGGSIPGKTKVASVAIYDMVEVMNYKMAHFYSVVMVLISFFVLLFAYSFNKRYNNIGL